MKFTILFLLVPSVIFAGNHDLFDEKAHENSEILLLALQKEFRLLSNRLESQDEKIKENQIEIQYLKNKVQQLDNPNSFRNEEALITGNENEFDSIDASIEVSSRPSNKSIEERLEKLEALSKTNTLRSCYEYQQYGITDSGTYTIDPDGALLGNEPFDVFCNFENGIATTEIVHNNDFVVDIPHCSEAFCYTLQLEYPTTMDQITALKQISDSCTQSITFGCFLSALSALDTPIGQWLNKNGEPEIYWDGNHHGTHVCSCGLNSNCSGSLEGYQCNCDYQIPVVQQDAGIITDIDALPVTAFQYGMMAYESQIATIQIGRFQCSGARYVDPNLLTESCGNLKTVGETRSGHYIMKDQSVAYCDMERQIDDPQIQSHVGHLSYNDVAFIAVKNTGASLPKGTISFDLETVDRGNDFSNSEGLFVAPKDGIYFFIFNGWTQTSDYTHVNAYVNGDYEREFYQYHPGQTNAYEEMTFFFTIELKRGDSLYLTNEYDSSLYAGSDVQMTFSGFYVN